MGPQIPAAPGPWPARTGCPLGPADVHLFAVVLGEPPATSLPLLDEAERSRADGFLRPADGASFAASRAALRRILAAYHDCAPAALRLHRGPAGKPGLAANGQAASSEGWPALEFSLARTGDLALIAVSTAPVGADIEQLAPRPGLAELAGALHSPAETSCIAAGCGRRSGLVDRDLAGFYRHWTAREAYLKATGLGLSGLRLVEVTCGPDPAIRFGGCPATDWLLSYPDVPFGHVAAVAASGPVTRYQYLAA